MKRYLLLLVVIALVLRFSLIFIAYHGDLNNNTSWGNLLLLKGPKDFYGSAKAEDWPYSAPNQPPLYLFIFSGTSWLNQSVEKAARSFNEKYSFFPSRFVWWWQENGTSLTVKIPGIIGDIGISWLIFRYFQKRNSERKGLLAAGIWLFNPVTWYNSAVWGQTDSLVNFIGFAAIIALIDSRLMLFVSLMTLSLLYKSSLAIFLPVLGVYALSKAFPLKTWFKAFGLFISLIFLTSIWFHPQINFIPWFINLYKDRILPGEIGYLTANAFNLWWIVDAGKTPDNKIFFLLPARIWGYIFSFSGIFLLMLRLKRHPNEKNLYFSLAVSAFITFFFMTRIHERYLYPFFLPATLLIGYFPELLGIYSALSIIHLFNLYHLFFAPGLPTVIMAYRLDWFIPLLIWFTVFLFISFIYIFLIKDTAYKKV